MTVYTYRAVSMRGADERATVVADSPAEAREALRARGLTAYELAPTDARRLGPRSGGPTGRFGRARAERETTALLRDVATLLGVGVPLLEALDTAAEQRSGRFRAVPLRLHQKIAEGRGLAEAMRTEPGAFDELCVAMTEAGEAAGDLDGVLDRFAEFRDRSRRFRGRVTGALAYPAVVVVSGVAVSIFLMTYVAPGLLQTLIEAGRPLPVATRVVRAASQWLLSWWWALPVAAVALAAAGRAALRHERARLAWHGALLRLPLLGGVLRRQEIVRLCVVLSALLRSGLTFPAALGIARRTTSNSVVRRALGELESAVGAGVDIGAAVTAGGAFPPAVARVFSVGQSSGRLEEMLDRLSRDYDQQVQSEVHRLMVLLEPVTIVLLACLVGTIAFAIILPILEIGNAV